MTGLRPIVLLRRPACWLALGLLLWSSLAAAQPAASEGQVKAAYLFKFAGFVEWPEGSFARPDSPLLIGVAGSDALAEQLDAMVAGRSVGGHALAVRKVRRGDALGGLHILFAGAIERGALTELFGAARGQAVLTVSDAPDAIALGAMIAFVMSDERLRFDVAMKPVAGARLRISARMLAAAHKVEGAT